MITDQVEAFLSDQSNHSGAPPSLVAIASIKLRMLFVHEAIASGYPSNSELRFGKWIVLDQIGEERKSKAAKITAVVAPIPKECPDEPDVPCHRVCEWTQLCLAARAGDRDLP
jgi:hypothetical protein